MVMRQGYSADLNGLGLNTGPVHQVGGRGMDKVGGKLCSNNSIKVGLIWGKKDRLHLSCEVEECQREYERTKYRVIKIHDTWQK